MTRPRHPKKELEALIRGAEEDGGWTATKGKVYFRLACGCGEHLEWVALSPSGANYAKNLSRHLRRTCWQEVK